MNHFENILSKQSFIILDGALATELEKRGANLNHALWSAKLLAENPSLIKEVYKDYLEVGANIIATASYQASFMGYEKQGYTQQEAIEFMQLSVSLAVQARADFLNTMEQPPAIMPLIAASIGPYGAALADGSEYTGYQNVTVDTLIDFHKKRLDVLANSAADILAFETIPCLEEAIAIKQLMQNYPTKQAWVSFSCKNETQIASGALYSDAVKLLEDSNQIIGVGVNCTAPEFILSLVEKAKPITQKIILVYPNKGEHYNPVTKEWEALDTFSSNYLDNAKAWLHAGAKAIGGCCRTGPEEIKQLSQLLAS